MIPNMCNDMHDCSVATGDTWLRNHLDDYVQWAKTHNSLFILTWDEDDFTSANQIPTMFVGANVQPGNYSENINHLHILHTLESMFGLAALGPAAPAITDVWVTSAPADDFSVALSPATLTVAPGASANALLGSIVTSGNPQNLSLSVSGAPAGVTASFNPASIVAGANATLTVAAAAGAAPATFTLTATATGPTATHDATLHVTVQGPTGSGLVNGDFEDGGLAGWTSTGLTAVSATAHHGAASAQLASSGGTQLSFWYQITCPDTVSYDWVTATLVDSDAGTTTKVLDKTCSNDGAWRQASATLVPGHRYTLTFANHDDDYAGDATFARFDEVVVGSTAPPPPPPPSPIVNAGFENGLTGWTSVGTNAQVSSAHGGGFSARVGSTSASRDSSLAQTFTAPAGTASLSFWYQVHCPDTVQYDWATVTLADATAGTTRTVVAKTCSNNGPWVQATAAIVAGHSYTLKLASHDDNADADPSYTLFDDVSLY